MRHILTTFHAPLPAELGNLQLLSERVLDAHGSKDRARLQELVEVISELSTDLQIHMCKEEQSLFPWIAQERHPPPASPIGVMMQEHQTAGAFLARIKTLTNNYQPPPYACASFSGLYAGLEQLNADLQTHIHLENNILFPRALDVMAGGELS
jgi:regulator of cell morphogenesis and NO signaling